VNTWRKEECCFLFSQVQPFNNSIAHLFRPKTADVKSKRDYHRETEHIGMIPVLQPDILLYLVFFQYATFIHGFDGGTECRDNYPEQFHQIRLTHPNAGDIIRHDDIAGFTHSYDISFHTHPIDMLLND
jgi:hypothetical protein